MSRSYPTTATGRMEAARRHTRQTFSDRNEILRALCAHYPSHVMPVTRNDQGGLVDLDHRLAVCVHVPPDDKPCAWIIDRTELDAFQGLEQLSVGHWDGATRADRSARLAELVRYLSAHAAVQQPRRRHTRKRTHTTRKSATRANRRRE